jgi:ER membrane protein complex subunit 2
MSNSAEDRPFADPASALQLSQKAPNLLSKSSVASASLPLSLIAAAESPETWMELVQLFYACLSTGDDKSAHLCLEKLTQRFGANNDKVMAMRGMYQEAVAEDEGELKKILGEYNKSLAESPMNVPIHKRRIAVIRALGRPQEAIMSLVDLLDSFPADVEGWCELSDLYQLQGMGSQAIFCLEEALLAIPNAWNLHARIGELEFMNSNTMPDGSESAIKSLVSAVQRFSRSIELCDDYLRGYYGLKLAVGKLLKTSSQSKSSSDSIPSEKLRKLDHLATTKLKAIVQARNAAATKDSERTEVIAAQELLDRSPS